MFLIEIDLYHVLFPFLPAGLPSTLFLELMDPFIDCIYYRLCVQIDINTNY